jgi:adenosylcobyric acid synthase
VESLAAVPGVQVAFVPLDADLDEADAVVLPGTKNTVDDLLAAREAGLGAALRAFDGPIVGVCGGYQLLGETIANASIEGTDDRDEVAGFGLLPVETVFSREKRVTRRTVQVDGAGPLSGATGSVTGYEIHMGTSTIRGDHPEPLEPGSIALGGLVGTYLHGLFENPSVRAAFVDHVFASAGVDRSAEAGAEAGTGVAAGARRIAGAEDGGEVDTSPYAAAADLVEAHLADLVSAYLD